MTRLGRFLAPLILLSLLAAMPASAQRRPSLDIAPPPIAGTGAIVTATNLFGEPAMRDLVRSGFPASLRYRLELWRTGGLFDDLEGHTEWDVIIQYDPSVQRYRVARRQNGRLEDVGSYATLATAQTVLETPTRAALVPSQSGARYYYTLALDIEALSVSDMDQLERWLRGVREGNPASALSNGMRTLMLRMLGGEKRHFSGHSPKFIAEK
jgi:Domain of unknown function (DUF4390)